MNVQINQLVKTLLKKDNLDQCSLLELEQFAERHPYFGAAQLLLTKKLQSEKPERYDEQLQKTFLFFNNPLWVQHLLNETGTAEVVYTEVKEEGPRIELAKPLAAGEEIAIKVRVLPAEDTVIKTETAINEGAISTESALPEPPITEAVEQQVEELPKAEKEKTEQLFEPFHTVDYFASQGIRFKEEPKPTDKFGKQLRSFTDWLKTMKRLPVAEVARTVTTDSEKKVEQLAEHSLDARDVLTEAMAEVWVKQGNNEKAAEIYRKLSLLDPSKSAYFAAKIEDLKKKN